MITPFLRILVSLAALLFTCTSFAAIRSDIIEYKDGKQVLEGQMFYDDEWKEPRPAVLVVHQWMGPTDHERNVAKKIVEKGYVAFVADIYGKGIRPQSTDEAGALAGKYKKDVGLLLSRQKAALQALQKTKKADPKRIIIAGYCFGGTAALEAARGKLPIIAAVSFHGGLATASPEKTKALKAKLLVLHGAVDPYVNPAEVQNFMTEMNQAGADYQFISYSGAVHAFTQKEAGNDPKKGAAYNEAADRRSWEAFSDFLHEAVANSSPTMK